MNGKGKICAVGVGVVRVIGRHVSLVFDMDRIAEVEVEIEIQ